MATGQLSGSRDKGLGFIQPDDGATTCSCTSRVERAAGLLNEGQKLSYESKLAQHARQDHAENLRAM